MGEDSQLKGIVVAIDGTSASGKTTLTRNIAAIYHCRYLLTGNLYRVLAKKLLARQSLDQESPEFEAIVRECIDMTTEQELEDASLGKEIISLQASMIATNKFVRDQLNKFQRSWIRKQHGAVIEGRDIGTVIWPQAEVKFFVTASVEVRAKRRFEELKAKGSNTGYQDILRDLIARDRRDAERNIAPLRAAKDAYVLDSSSFSIADITNEAVKFIEKRIDNHFDKV